ncbi:type II/IV secretion system ATPase subunit, partial [Methanococcoides sp. SA1]|nr:type II/IV secretion system ATPase subunit [Methanococcoides sp. SA1]
MNHCGVMMVKKTEKRTEESRSDDGIDAGLKPAVKNDHDLINGTEESLSGLHTLSTKETAPENGNETFPQPSLNHEEPETFKPETASSSSTLDRFAFEEPKIFKPISGMDIEKKDLDAVILRPRGRNNSYPLDIPKTSDDKEMEEEFGILLPKSDKFANPHLSAHDPTEEWVPAGVKYANIDQIVSPSEDKIEPSSVNSDANIFDVKDETFDMDEKAEKQSNEIHDEQLAEGTDEALVEQSADTKSERVSAENIGFIQKIKNLFSRENEVIEAYDPEIHGMLSYFDGIENYEELDRYWVNEPYVFIVILYNEDNNDHLYYAVEPQMSDFETVFLAEVQDRLRNKLLVEKIDENDDKEKVIEREIRDIIKDYAIGITPTMLEKIFYYTRRDFISFGKIDPLMHDDSLEDISGNGHSKPIFLYHKNYQNIATNIVFDEEELNSFIIQLAQRSGKHISVADPMVDATMPDGSRIQMTLGKTVTTHGSTFTIRKFNEVPITPVDLLKWGTFSPEAM